MKRSRSIPLVVIGTLSLVAGCEQAPEEPPMQLTQEFYSSRDDCEKDWGPEPENCTPTEQLANFDDSQMNDRSRTSYRFAGPRYYWDRSIGHPIAVLPTGQTRVITGSHFARGTPSTAKSASVSHVSRGGFGSSAHASSSGG